MIREPKQSGFTLIETLVYIALFTVLIGGGIIFTHNVVTGTTNTDIKIFTEEEANFVLGKIDWVLAGVNTINFPTAGNIGDTLSVDKTGFGSNPVVVDLSSGAIRVSRGGGQSTSLTSSRITIDNLEFEHVAADSSHPATVIVRFDVDGRQFISTRYIR